MRGGSYFKNTPDQLFFLYHEQVPVNSKAQLLLLENMFIAKQSKQKERVFRRMKVELRAAGCCFPNDLKGQRAAHTTQVTCFENISEFAVLFTPFFFADV